MNLAPRPAPTCSEHCRASSGRTAGSWPNRPTTPGPGRCSACCATVRWEAGAVRDGLRAYAVEHLGADGILVVDETGFLKKDRASAGVQKRCTGTAGRIENAQVGVFLALATERGRA
uniref:transposase n=1 Tax=Streptomyces albidoflavus TaxID=1886 RepID=UPI0038D14A1C